MVKTENILNLDYDNVTNDLVRKSLVNVCKNNKKLKNFINKFFRENKDVEILAWEDYGWEWDIECYGEDDGAEMAICNHDFRDDDCHEGDGWEINDCHPAFAKYFHNFNWDDITLDNGKMLILVDNQDYFAFHILDFDNLEDGKVDWYGISWF